VNLAEHFRLIWRRRWIILALSAIIAAAVYVRSQTLDEVYESSATLDVISSTAASDRAITAEEVDIRTSRYAALADSSPLLRDAIDVSGLEISVNTARDRVSAAVPSDGTGFVTITASGPSPDDAHSLADGVVDALEATGEGELNPIQVVTGATTPAGSASPTPARDAVLAFLIALVVNSELFALFGFVGGRFTKGSESEEIARLTGVPVLALIPLQRDKWATEAFRNLRARIDFARSDPPARSLAIISADPGSGASFAARGLAQATADLNIGVVLVDANLRRPAIAADLDIPEEPGLAEIIERGTVDWDALPRVDDQDRFRVVPAGAEVEDPAGVLGSGALRKTLDQLNGADQIVVDAPAVGESLDALVIASQCDAAILVIDAEGTRRRAVENAVLRINQANVQLLGTVINRVAPDDRTRPPRRTRHPTSPEE